MSNTVLVLLGAGIGAGGAVAAQVIASIFTARHDTKRFRWERQAKETEWANQKAERFLAQKQQLYSDYAVLVNRFLDYIGRNLGELPKPVTRPDAEELDRITASVEMIAPARLGMHASLVRSMMLNSADKSDDLSLTEDQADEVWQNAEASSRGCIDLMREDLTGEKRRFFFAKGDLDNLPPDKPPGRLPWWTRRKLKPAPKGG